MLEIFRCLACGWSFEALPGPHTCPVCANLYVRWETYDERRFFPWRFQDDKRSARLAAE